MWYLLKNSTHDYLIEADCFPSEMMFGTMGGTCTSGSPGYQSITQLKLAHKILSEPCKLCGRLVETHYYPEAAAPLIEHNLCHSCNFWREKVIRLNTKERDRIMVCGGGWYFCGPVQANGTMGFKGFGGSQFIFQRLQTGKIVVSRNVWFGGHVPAHFKTQIPDNAIIIPYSDRYYKIVKELINEFK